MKISAKSDGTVRLLTLIPALYDDIYQNKIIFVDEIDNSIHPNLMFELLKFYANTKSNGQLIFTTHTTKLLNQQELVRPDEIWLTEKSEGNTRMYSLNDFKLHNTLNIENGYLDGRYGGIPVIEEIDAEV
jgi:AAA15 family ATPase/GTPase